MIDCRPIQGFVLYSAVSCFMLLPPVISSWPVSHLSMNKAYIVQLTDECKFLENYSVDAKCLHLKNAGKHEILTLKS